MPLRANDLEPDEEEFLEKFAVSGEAVRARQARCPSPDLILAARSGTLPEETASQVSEHLSACLWCQTLARDLVDAEISSLTPEEEGRIRGRVLSALGERAEARAPFPRRFWPWLWRPVPLATVAAVAIAAALWVHFRPRTAPEPPSSAIASRQAAPEDPKALKLEKLAVKLPAAGALIWRGEARTEQERYAAELAEALAPYQTDNFPEAARRLENLAQKYPRAAEAHIYLGVCRLYLGNNLGAIESLETADRRASEALTQDVSWYLSLAYHRAGRTELARERLLKLCHSQGERAARACAGIEELSGPTPGAPQR